MSSNNSKMNSRSQSGKPSSKSVNANQKVLDPYNDNDESSAKDSPISLDNKDQRRKIQINIGDQDDIESGNSLEEERENKESPVNKSIIDKNLNDSNTRLKNETNINEIINDNKDNNSKNSQREVTPMINHLERKDSESKKSNLQKFLNMSKSKDNIDEEIENKNDEELKKPKDKHVHYEESNRLKLLDDKEKKGKIFSYIFLLIRLFNTFIK